MIAESAVTVVLAYLMGAFPSAYVVARWLGGLDIRGLGSENPGALNAYRQLGKGAGLFVLLLDAGKGALAIIIGQRIGAHEIGLYVAALTATLGHNFSPFLGFRGGKGAATVLGISAVMLWQLTAVAALTRIHRRTALGTALEEASGCSSESGIMVLEQKPARKQGAPNRCCHRTNPTVSASSLTTIAWWPMPACSCRPP